MTQYYLLTILIILTIEAVFIAIRFLPKKVVFCFIIIPLIIALYWHWGAFGAWKEAIEKERRIHEAQTVLKTIKSPNELIEKLKAQLLMDPTKAEGWYLLGRLYASQQQWPEAEKAFDKALIIRPNHRDTIINLVYTSLQNNRGQLKPSMQQLLEQLLEQEPNQLDSLALLGQAAFNNKAYDKALSYWRKLLAQLPSDSPQAASVQQHITKAVSQTHH